MPEDPIVLFCKPFSPPCARYSGQKSMVPISYIDIHGSPVSHPPFPAFGSQRYPTPFFTSLHLKLPLPTVSSIGTHATQLRSLSVASFKCLNRPCVDNWPSHMKSTPAENDGATHTHTLTQPPTSNTPTHTHTHMIRQDCCLFCRFLQTYQT